MLAILLAASFLAAVPATAAAVPDERAVARHFADAALRAEPEIEAASTQLEAIGKPVTCKVWVPRRRRTEVRQLTSKLATAQTIAGFTRTVGPTLDRAVEELGQVKTRERALRRGRLAWHDVRASYAGFAKLPAANVCDHMRAYVVRGYRHTCSTRRGVRAYAAMTGWDTRKIDRNLKAAVERLVERRAGLPSRRLRRRARLAPAPSPDLAAHAPAPTRPLSAPRAASYTDATSPASAGHA